MSPPNQPRCRARKPKTRTGCKTCKIRRVKCDEQKPFCARCLKFGADCEGYEVEPRPPKSGLREIIPRQNHYQALPSPSPGKPPFTTVFQDNREYSYFLYFQEEAVADIAGAFDRSLWSHVLIQASWNEQSLCRLIASLGALYKARRAKALNLSKETDSHQQYALQQYGRALKSVQTRISAIQYRDTTRIALIASLLIYCFENFHGELDSAVGHLESALQLMHQQLAHAGCRYKHSENKSPSSALDDDLVAAFFRLDSGLLSRDAISDSDTVGSRLGTNYLENVREVPERFNTISEARNFLENIQFPAIPSLTRDLTLQVNNILPLPGNIDERAMDMYTTMSSQLRQWDVAFAPLYAETLTPSSKDFVGATTLRARALSTELASQRVCALELDSSYFNQKSREIVDLSRIVADDPSFLKSFVWDCGIIPSLSIVLACCLDRSIRKEALQLLKQSIPRREGVWDSLTAAKFGEEICRWEPVDC